MIFISETGKCVEISPWYDEDEMWATKGFYDKLDKLAGRIKDLEADVEYYMGEIVRNW